MQKLKLVNGTFVENVIEMNDYVERNVQNQDSRNVLNINIVDTDFNTMMSVFSNPNNLTSIEVYRLTDVQVGVDEETGEPITEQQYVAEGLLTNYTILNRISGNIQLNTFTIQLHQKSEIEQQLIDTQLALAELGMLLSPLGGN